MNLLALLKRQISSRIAKRTRLTKKTPTISKRQFRAKETGLSLERLASEHKAGVREYKAHEGSTPAATESQARSQITTRKSNREQRALPQYNRTPTNAIVYIDTRGIVAHDFFWKDNLRIMHNFRDDVAYAKATGDGSVLRPYRQKIIMTYDGPELRNYNNKNTRIYPETSLRKILKVENAMTDRQRAKYHADINYRHLAEAAE